MTSSPSRCPLLPLPPTIPANDTCTVGDTTLKDRLRASGLVTTAQLAAAQQEAFETGRRILDVLVDDGVVDDGEVAALLSFELGIPWVDPSLIRYDIRFTESLPRWVAEAMSVVPVHFQERADGSMIMYLAMDDPTDADAALACSIWAGMPVRPLVASTLDIRETIEAWYAGGRLRLSVVA